MSKVIIIKNGQIINAPGKDVQGNKDILIKDGIIEKIADKIDEKEYADAQIIDAKEKWVMPAFVDMHVHLREPGFEYKEDIKSGTLAAVHGGYGTVVAMPNTAPVVDDVSILKYIEGKAKEANNCRVYSTATITKGMQGKEISEMGRLQQGGAIAFTDDGKPVSNPAIMRLAMQYSLNFDALLLSHCEELSLSDGGAMHEGYTSYTLGLKGIPAAAEEAMVARDILLAQAYGARLHICHLSTKRSADLVRAAKAEGTKVTCETAPHYFSANDEWVAQTGYDTNTKMNPPLRSKEDVEAIKAALADGTIDAIATDHAPHIKDEKFVEYISAYNGIVGLETAFSLGVTNLIRTNVLTPEQFVEKMSTRPAEILGLPYGEIKEGAAADITIADAQQDIVYSQDMLHSKSKNTPFLDRPYFGKIIQTIVNGETKI